MGHFPLDSIERVNDETINRGWALSFPRHREDRNRGIHMQASFRLLRVVSGASAMIECTREGPS